MDLLVTYSERIEIVHTLQFWGAITIRAVEAMRVYAVLVMSSSLVRFHSPRLVCSFLLCRIGLPRVVQHGEFLRVLRCRAHVCFQSCVSDRGHRVSER